MRSRPATAILFLVGACTDPDPGPAPVPGPVPIVGTWRIRLPSGEAPDVTDVQEITFSLDGTYTSSASPQTAAYQLVGDRLRTYNPSGTGYRETEYERRNELVVFHALRPVGDVVELVGVWQGTEVFDSEREHVEADWGLELRADGTARYSLGNTAQDFAREGSWTRDPDGWWLRFEADDAGVPLGQHFAILNDTTIGKYSYMKID